MRLSRRQTLFPVVALLVAVAAGAARGAAPVDDAFFEAKVRPVLAERCYSCHSAAAEKLKGGLRLDRRDDLMRGGEGGAVIMPGRPEQSRLIVSIGYGDPDLQMPPKSKLGDDQIAALTEWVRAGAPWPKRPDAATALPVAAAPAFDLAKRKASHWAWQPIRPQAPPDVKDASWPKSAIDRFVLAKLEENNLAPAPPADRRTLIRRAYFDLVGLPPTLSEVEGFVADESPDAFAKVVDGLLADPHFGERWARHWLDLVRYAETRGHEFDGDIPGAYQYRDYVIRALNADVPYDQFVTEHVAGDLLPRPRLDASGQINESMLGTGFWYLSEWIHSPVDIRDDETNRVDNQIDVFGKAFLGLTVGCARCHDHKFDAIAQKDYYALAGFLHGSSYRDARFMHEAANRDVLRRVREADEAAARRAARAFAVAARPTLDRLADYLLAARDATAPDARAATGERVTELAAERRLDPAVLTKWIDEVRRATRDSSDPLHAWAVVAREGGEPSAELLKPLAGGGADQRAAGATASASAPASLIVDYASPRPGEWIADGYAFGNGPVRAGQIVPGVGPARPLVVREMSAADSSAGGPKLPGMVRTPTFTVVGPKVWYLASGSGQAFACVDSHRMVAGPLHGVTRRAIKVDEPGWHWVGHDLHDYVGQRAHVEFTSGGQAAAPLAVAAVWQGETPPPGPATSNALILKLLATPPASAAELAVRYQSLFEEVLGQLESDALARAPDAGDRARLANWLLSRADWLVPAGDRPALAQLLDAHRRDRAALLATFKDSPTAMAMLDANGWDEHLLLRGSHKTPGDAVPRRFLEAIAGDHQPSIAAGSGRLELARRMVDSSDPLLPRVMVNRVWHHLFGRGIVASVDNFGVLGDAPTHPELLDALAGQFVRDGWSVKRLIRSVMLSSTYQMSSRHDDARADELDPDDRLLHRARVRRLEGEAIRDAILAVSGRLDPAMFGPSIDVYLTPFMDGRGRPAGGGPLDGAGRRSIYTKVRRNFLPPMMTAFDMPTPFSCMGRRTVSNVPAQALTLFNDPFVVQQADLWAKRILAEPNLTTPRQRVERMYEQAFARPPTEAEASAAEAFLKAQAEQVGDTNRDARAWADLAHVLLNVKEFVFVN